MRGWTEFEKRIIDCKGFSDVGLRTTVVLPEGFDADCSDQVMVRHLDWWSDEDFEGPPLKPSRFDEKLRQLHEVAHGSGVRLFTNGQEDMDLVRRKYADSYALLTQSTFLSYITENWSSDDFECLVEALPDFTDLREFHFMYIKLSTDQAQRLAVAISHCRACSDIFMAFNSLTLSGQCALFGQWRASPFGAAVTAACVNCVVAAAACAADALLTANIARLSRGVSFLSSDSIFAWLSDPEFFDQVCHERIREPE